jgi:hypothetical protein
MIVDLNQLFNANKVGRPPEQLGLIEACGNTLEPWTPASIKLLASSIELFDTFHHYRRNEMFSACDWYW